MLRHSRFDSRWLVPGLLALTPVPIAGCEQLPAATHDKYVLAQWDTEGETGTAGPAARDADGAASVPTAAQPAATVGAVGIAVSDLKRSVDFYARVLGMKQTQRFSLPNMDEVVLGYEDARGASVVLMHYTDGTDVNVKDLPVKLVLNVVDPRAVVEKIRAEGLEITREPAPLPLLGNLIVALAKDPDGYVIELLEAGPSS